VIAAAAASAAASLPTKRNFALRAFGGGEGCGGEFGVIGTSSSEGSVLFDSRDPDDLVVVLYESEEFEPDDVLESVRRATACPASCVRAKEMNFSTTAVGRRE
jgi:hypothetical protein